MAILPTSNGPSKRVRTLQHPRKMSLMSAIRVRSVRERGRLLSFLASITLLFTFVGIGLFFYSEAYFKRLKSWKLKKALGIPLYRSHLGTFQMDYVPGSASDRIRECGGQGNSAGLVIHMVHMATSSHKPGEFPARYSCAVEAAAATGADVVVHSSSLRTGGRVEDALWPSLQDQGSEADRRAASSSVKNVYIKNLDVDSLFESLPLQEWYEVEIIQRKTDLVTGLNTEVPSSWHWPSNGINMTAQDLSNAVRLAVLWHDGGLYLDLDMILLRNDARDMLVKGLQPVIGRDIDTVNNAAMMFPEPRHRFLHHLMGEFAQVTENAGGHRRWGDHGPRLLKRVLEKWNSARQHEGGESNSLEQVETYSVSTFEPFHYRQIEPMVKDPLEDPVFWEYLQNSVCQQHEPTVGMHFFNSKTRALKISPTSLLASVMKWRCPLSYSRMKAEGQIATSPEH